MQYFQDMHSFPVDKPTAKNPMSLSTKTIKLWAITYEFAVVILFQFNDFG